jgi:hypothetical protein
VREITLSMPPGIASDALTFDSSKVVVPADFEQRVLGNSNVVAW